MADVVALRKANDGAQLLEHYSHLLKRSDEVDEYSQLIPLDHLSMLNEVIEASLNLRRVRISQKPSRCCSPHSRWATSSRTDRHLPG